MVKVEDLNGKVIIITGGGGAIGSAMAKQFAANGVKVVVAGRTAATLHDVVTSIREEGGECSAIITDVSDKKSAEDMIAKTVELYGRVDCLVNNAGINGGVEDRKPIHEYNDDLWQRIINVDLNGVYYCSNRWKSRAMAAALSTSVPS